MEPSPEPSPPWHPPGWLFFAAALVPALAMAWIVFRLDRLTGEDAYFHLKMGLLFPEAGLARGFPWLRWTHFHDRFVNQHYGFHAVVYLLTRPGTLLGWAPETSAKFILVLAAALNARALQGLCRRHGAVAVLAGSLLFLFVPWHYWLRHSYLRAFILASAFLLLATTQALAGRWVRLTLVMWLGLQAYNISVVYAALLPTLALGFVIAGQRAHALRLLCFGGLGIVLGMMLNPYFPANVDAMRLQLLDIAIPAPREVGSEWKSMDGWYFVRIGAPLLALWSAGLLWRLARGPLLDARSLALLLANVFLLLLTLKTRRTYEYWPLFAIASTVDLAAPALRLLEARPSLLRIAAPVFLLAGLAYFSRQAERIHPRSIDPLLPEAHAWLRANSPAGSLVFLDDWDEFSEAFFLNHHNRYPVGLDPVYTSKPFPLHWEAYRVLTRGQAPRQVHTRAGSHEVTLTDIPGLLDCRYVLVTPNSARLCEQLKASPAFRQRFPVPAEGVVVYGQAGVTVFEAVASGD